VPARFPPARRKQIARPRAPECQRASAGPRRPAGRHATNRQPRNRPSVPRSAEDRLRSLGELQSGQLPFQRPRSQPRPFGQRQRL